MVRRTYPQFPELTFLSRVEIVVFGRVSTLLFSDDLVEDVDNRLVANHLGLITCMRIEFRKNRHLQGRVDRRGFLVETTLSKSQKV